MAMHLSRGWANFFKESSVDSPSAWLYNPAMATKTKKGQPKRRHDAQLNFRLTEEHDALIREAAEHSGQTLTNWIRGVLVREARKELQR